MLFSTVLPGGISARDVNAGAVVRRDHVAVGRRRAADLIVGRVVDPHAVGRVAGIGRPEDVAAAGRDADVVGLDEISRGTDAADVDAVVRR